MLNKAQVTLSLADAAYLHQQGGGVEKDAGDLYTSLSQEEKNRIEITNKSYKSGNSGNPCTR
jgi:hypothetical protein